jgi:anti-repressor protein
MTSLDLFTYQGAEVRTLVVDGEPWFVAADVAAVVGISKYRDAVAQLDDDERASMAVDTLGGRQSMTVVNEPGVYSLMLISRSPRVRDFKRWLTHEVLPSIRRTGQFGSQVPTSLAEALELAAAEARRIEELEAAALEAAPKVEAYDALMDAEGYYSMEAAAKILGLGRNTFFRRLRELDVIQHGSRLPYQRHMHHFVITAATYTTPDGAQHTSHTARLRPSGLDYLRKRLAGDPLAIKP